MPNFSNTLISNTQAYIVDARQWMIDVDVYISTVAGDYSARRQAESVIIRGTGIGQNCPIGNQTDILGNEGLFNMSFDVLEDLDSLTSILKTNLSEAEVSIINSALAGFVAWSKQVNNFLKKPIPSVNINTGGFATQDNISFCGIIVSQAVTNFGNTLIQTGQTLINGFKNNAIQPPPSTVMSPITVPDNAAGKLFEFLQRLYDKTNNDDYVIITRTNQIKALTSDLKTTIDNVLANSRTVNSNVYDSRTELKEARQGIKDLLGLDTKFYTGSVSTKEILDRLNEIHQLENDVLYEIRTRTEEIKSFCEAIRGDVTTIIDTLQTMENQQKDDYNNTLLYIFNLITTLQNNITAEFVDTKQLNIDNTALLLQKLNTIDGSVGS